MANLAVEVNADDVPLIAPVYEKFGKCEIYSGVAGETITAGAPLYIDGTTGRLGLADAAPSDSGGEEQFRGIALTGGGTGSAIDYIVRGPIYGYTFLTTDYADDIIYLSDDVGRIADAAGSTTVIVGRVSRLTDVDNHTKVLFVDVAMAAAAWA